ncbi:MAG: ATP-binding protein [Actinobacteria bacterium]|nr:ATP-binding protein [Actinomycetota bacterium]MCG2818851.1 ATP-binding protein [Actinomycetes bacterium]MBU4218665.1 ATP-binding protein [Actinomycetota bacterium]MBU4360188.1 ATP-binding protein [Actinomycetota bacterium]MBU4393057.1 ATP-binding protein [Actinomycetota bacterium]
MIIAVASGKGGTGKTTVSTSLAWLTASSGPLTFLDCDVEEPDAHFYLKPSWDSEWGVNVEVPRIDSSCCDGCGKCADFCRYNALAAIQSDVLVFEELCHSCRGCAIACPLDCVSMVPRRLGIIRSGTSGEVAFRQGLLDIGEPMSPPIIRKLKDEIPPGGEAIVDCPPGAGCPMIVAITGADYCILVTEPSPFGKHDLDIAHQVAGQLGIPHGVVINKSTVHDGIIEEYCTGEGIPLLGKIPYSREAAQHCSRGELLAEADTATGDIFRRILEGVTACRQGSSLS